MTPSITLSLVVGHAIVSAFCLFMTLDVIRFCRRNGFFDGWKIHFTTFLLYAAINAGASVAYYALVYLPKDGAS